MNESDIDELSSWAEVLLKKLSESERKKLMKGIALKLRKSTQARMKRQENPDGSKWAARKSTRKRSGARVHKSVTFLYDVGGGQPRIRRLQSWRSTPQMMIGFDPDRMDVRSFRKDRVVRYIDIDTTSSSVRKRGTVRQKAMFTKLRQTKFLKATANSSGLVLSLPSIARVHQFGERTKLSKSGPDYTYDQRELLGLSSDDLKMITSEILEHVTP